MKGENRCFACPPLINFINGDDCIPCSDVYPICDQCARIDGDLKCINCTANLILDETTAKCFCPKGSFLDSIESECKDCVDACADCVEGSSPGSEICLECKSTADVIWNDKCIPLVCYEGTFRNFETGFCDPCSEEKHCLTCIESAEKCLSC